MKAVLLLVSLLLLSESAWARKLSCSIYTQNFQKEIATQEVELDRKPVSGETIKVTEMQRREAITLGEVRGTLNFWMSATWYNGHSNGFLKLNNMPDSLPATDVGAFFYKTKEDGKDEDFPTLISFRVSETPGFNVNAKDVYDPSHVLFDSYGKYRMVCGVYP